jgi:hypothetical protein
MADRKYYVICDIGCKFESMTKEQILTAIMQAVKEGTIGDIDTGFITTIKTINGHGLKFFIGPQSEFESLSEDERQDLFPIITNDTTIESINAAIEVLQNDFESVRDGLADGSFIVNKAENAPLSFESEQSITIVDANEYVKLKWNTLYMLIVELEQNGDVVSTCVSNLFIPKRPSVASIPAYYTNYRSSMMLCCEATKSDVEFYARAPISTVDGVDYFNIGLAAVDGTLPSGTWRIKVCELRSF